MWQASRTRPKRQSQKRAKSSLEDGDRPFGNDPLYKPELCFHIGTNDVGSLAKTTDDNNVKNQKLRQLIESFQLDGMLSQECDSHWKKLEPQTNSSLNSGNGMNVESTTKIITLKTKR
mmetsp:Transcript_25887/g.39168  ORF Transcript_25887/g.39168 Transcript_25887/m.39168 type:complete len:118 (+) Transcript_25887:501-854(+)